MNRQNDCTNKSLRSQPQYSRHAPKAVFMTCAESNIHDVRRKQHSQYAPKAVFTIRAESSLHDMRRKQSSQYAPKAIFMICAERRGQGRVRTGKWEEACLGFFETYRMEHCGGCADLCHCGSEDACTRRMIDRLNFERQTHR